MMMDLLKWKNGYDPFGLDLDEIITLAGASLHRLHLMAEEG